jgi:GWxTD domain-containing protein
MLSVLVLFVYLFTVGFEQNQEISATQTPQDDFYEQGVKLRDAGDWEQALKVWWQGRNALEQQGLTDPRIGIAFIQLATEMKAKKYYGTASDMYFWGLSPDAIPEYVDVIRQECSRIEPWLEDEELEKWRLSLEQNDVSTIVKRIKQFWLARDPTPATEGNERLLLHWERIAFAGEHFKKTTNSPYGTDDRGLVYVICGEPTRKTCGHFDTVDDNPEYEVWIYESLDPEPLLIFMFGKNVTTGIYGIRYGLEDFVPKHETRFDYVLQITDMCCSELAELDPIFEDLCNNLVDLRNDLKLTSLMKELAESANREQEMERDREEDQYIRQRMEKYQKEAFSRQAGARRGSRRTEEEERPSRNTGKKHQ